MSKAETLRGLITEKLAAASREILAAVDRIVTEYEAEAAGFRREIDRQRRQLELRSGPGAADGDEQPEAPEAGSSLTGTRCLSPRVAFARQRCSRPHAAASETHVELWVQVLDEAQPEEISGHGSAPQRLRCPRGLREEDFLRLLRSSVPALAGDEPFDVLVADRKRKLWHLDLKVTTPEEIGRRIGSSTLYIRLHRHLRSDSTPPPSTLPLSSASPEDFLCSSSASRPDDGGAVEEERPVTSGVDADTSEAVEGKEGGDAGPLKKKRSFGETLRSESAPVERGRQQAGGEAGECGVRGETSDAVKDRPQSRRTDRPDAGRKSFLCGVCGKSLSDQRSLSRHKMTHSGEKPHGCSVCGRRFKLVGTLKQHEKIHGRRERTYLCDVCCKMFLTAKQLHVHMRQHTNEKPFRCAECGKDFTTRGPLTAHMRVHTGETPYRCPDCGWAFKRKIHLDNHMTVHSGVKPFVCGICGKACARKTYLNVHMRTHNGERPYKCTVCDKDFTQSHCLKTHMRSHQAT